MMVDQVVLSCPTHNADALSSGTTCERLGIVMFDIRVDTRWHPPWRIAAPCVARTSSKQELPGRGVDWCWLDRNNSRACARLTYRGGKEFIRHAKHSDHPDYCRHNSARPLACTIWAGSPPDPRTNAQSHRPVRRPALAREGDKLGN